MLTKLIIGMLKIGTIGYGGGAATMPLMKKEFVEKHKIITEEEFIEILAICNVLPGPLITKYCAVLGYRAKGVIGAILCVISIILPSSIMLLGILKFITSADGSNTHIQNMINAILPVVTVILSILVVDFYRMSNKKLETKKLIKLILIFSFFLLVLRVNTLFLILGLILACLFVPKTEGE